MPVGQKWIPKGAAMDSSRYEVISYRPELLPQIVTLMQHLWGRDFNSNHAYFKWKYEDNPYTDSPLGMVALCQGRVVGFRGYLATRFEAGENNRKLTFLSPGDTCIHPDHRRVGLSVSMGNQAMKEYAGTCRLLFNTSCTRSSLPGYMRMGFFPLTPKTYLTQSSILGLLKYIPTARKSIPLSFSGIRFGKIDNILVSRTPKPEAMSLLVAGQSESGSKIRILRDEDFFRWRFCSPLHKYIFYYAMKADQMTGYVVMGVSPNNRRGYILDYAEKVNSVIGEILTSIIKARQFHLLSIYNFGLDKSLMQTLCGQGFKAHGLVRIIERKLHGELPLLIRPVKEIFDNRDFFVEGIDSRRFENWSLKPICSDAA
jgi:hypothetical protein